MTKIYGLLQLTIVCTLHNYAISIDSYSPINKFESFIIFRVLINAVILPLNCLVLILFTPQPIRAVGVLFSPMVSGWMAGPGCISETIRRSKLILGRDIG